MSHLTGHTSNLLLEKGSPRRAWISAQIAVPKALSFVTGLFQELNSKLIFIPKEWGNIPCSFLAMVAYPGRKSPLLCRVVGSWQQGACAAENEVLGLHSVQVWASTATHISNPCALSCTLCHKKNDCCFLTVMAALKFSSSFSAFSSVRFLSLSAWLILDSKV